MSKGSEKKKPLLQPPLENFLFVFFSSSVNVCVCELNSGNAVQVFFLYFCLETIF